MSGLTRAATEPTSKINNHKNKVYLILFHSMVDFHTLFLVSPGCVSQSPSCAAAPPADLSLVSAGLDSGLPASWPPAAALADPPAAPAEPGRETPAVPGPHPDLEYSRHQKPAGSSQ